MPSRVVGYPNERRRDRRREILIEAMLDDQPVRILDIGLSGFGADGAKKVTKDLNWPEVDQLSELRFTDYKGRDVLILVTITNVEIEECRFGGNFTELPGNAFDVLQDIVMMRDLRAAAVAQPLQILVEKRRNRRRFHPLNERGCWRAGSWLLLQLHRAATDPWARL